MTEYNNAAGSPAMPKSDIVHEDDDLISYIICSIADFTVELATGLTLKAGKQWVPKILARQKGRRCKVEASGNENRPKRPQTSYFLWCESIRKRMKETDPGKSINTKDLSKMWKSLPNHERQAWERKSAEEKEAYCRRLAAYRNHSEASHSSPLPTGIPVGSVSSPPPVPTMKPNQQSVPPPQYHPPVHDDQIW